MSLYFYWDELAIVDYNNFKVNVVVSLLQIAFKPLQ